MQKSILDRAREVFDIRPSGYLVKPAGKEQLEFELKNLRFNSYREAPGVNVG